MTLNIDDEENDINKRLNDEIKILRKNLKKISEEISISIESKNNFNISPRERCCPLSIGLRFSKGDISPGREQGLSFAKQSVYFSFSYYWYYFRDWGCRPDTGRGVYR